MLEVLPKRFAKYGLTLHPEKTRLMHFGRSALEKAEREGTKPATFDFLGFTYKCARSRNGKFTLHVKTMKKRLRRSLKAVAAWCRRHRHDPMEEQQGILNAKLRGHYQYYGRPRTTEAFGSSTGSVHLEKGAEPADTGTAAHLGHLRHILQRYSLAVPRIARPWLAR